MFLKIICFWNHNLKVIIEAYLKVFHLVVKRNKIIKVFSEIIINLEVDKKQIKDFDKREEQHVDYSVLILMH